MIKEHCKKLKVSAWKTNNKTKDNMYTMKHKHIIGNCSRGYKMQIMSHIHRCPQESTNDRTCNNTSYMTNIHLSDIRSQEEAGICVETLCCIYYFHIGMDSTRFPWPQTTKMSAFYATITMHMLCSVYLLYTIHTLYILVNIPPYYSAA